MISVYYWWPRGSSILFSVLSTSDDDADDGRRRPIDLHALSRLLRRLLESSMKLLVQRGRTWR